MRPRSQGSGSRLVAEAPRHRRPWRLLGMGPRPREGSHLPECSRFFIHSSSLLTLGNSKTCPASSSPHALLCVGLHRPRVNSQSVQHELEGSTGSTQGPGRENLATQESAPTLEILEGDGSTTRRQSGPVSMMTSKQHHNPLPGMEVETCQP
eukprot:XP_022268931.1 small integral membrane protein 11A isoform X1 [Canis lupus familiaris]